MPGNGGRGGGRESEHNVDSSCSEVFIFFGAAPGASPSWGSLGAPQTSVPLNLGLVAMIHGRDGRPSKKANSELFWLPWAPLQSQLPQREPTTQTKQTTQRAGPVGSFLASDVTGLDLRMERRVVFRHRRSPPSAACGWAKYVVQVSEAGMAFISGATCPAP